VKPETCKLERDAAGQLVSEKDFTGRSVQYEYDAAGRRAGAQHPDARQRCWHYSLCDYYLISHQSVDIPALFDPKGCDGYWHVVGPASLRRRALQQKGLRLWV
jgi:YD repeat-containing protein